MKTKLTICALTLALLACKKGPIRIIDGERVIVPPKECVTKSHQVSYNPRDQYWNLNCVDAQNRALFYYYDEKKNDGWVQYRILE